MHFRVRFGRGGRVGGAAVDHRQRDEGIRGVEAEGYSRYQLDFGSVRVANHVANGMANGDGGGGLAGSVAIIS